MVRAFVGLGSNLGERRETLRAAIGRLRGLAEVEVKGVSTFRDTEPVDYLDQPRFLNGAVEIETELSARALLGACRSPTSIWSSSVGRLARVPGARRWRL